MGGFRRRRVGWEEGWQGSEVGRNIPTLNHSWLGYQIAFCEQ